MKNNCSFKQKQQGVVLAVSLILLLVMTLVGISGMSSVSIEEKMVRNIRDKNLSYEASETALSAGERNLLNYTDAPFVSPSRPDPAAGEIWRANGPSNDPEPKPNWWKKKPKNWWLPLNQGGNGNIIADDLNAYAHQGASAGYSQPPVYITEYFDFKKDNKVVGQHNDATGVTYYRLTAYGAGNSINDAGEPKVVSIHQTTYTRRF